ncbi:MAG: glycosyltransferase family A protein [Pseudomonadota bacterium]
MRDVRVSVVIVSHKRPQALARCLTALKFQFLPIFECVVVADSGALAELAARADLPVSKTITFERPNIAAARNLGLQASGGEVVAFIDDDAIAEPTWLEELLRGFEDDTVAAVGGFVWGRNGFDLQYSGAQITSSGQEIDLNITTSTIFRASDGICTKTVGTNCAFRRDVLVALGGFDQSFAYFLDETDMNLRLFEAGHSTAIVPQALVHHETQASWFRGADRRPLDLHVIGRSVGCFQRKHGLARDFVDHHGQHQLRRCHQALIDGRLEPRDIALRMAEFWSGAAAEHNSSIPSPDLSEASEFLPIKRPIQPVQSHILVGWWLGRHSIFAQARTLAKQGDAVSVFLFSRTSIFHKRWFHSDGFWIQSGGLFGRSHRTGPLLRLASFEKRLGAETLDLQTCRKFMPRRDQ